MPDRVSVLDNGYIELIESWGSDERIIESARVSTNKGFLGWSPLRRCEVCGREWECSNESAVCTQSPCINSPTKLVHPGDEKLLKYLWTNQHTTPFEMAGAMFEIQAPIMVFREHHRHRTQSYSEMSARYVQMPDIHYSPTLERIKQVSAKNKQAGSLAPLAPDDKLQQWLDDYKKIQGDIYSHYEDGLKMGVPKEIARLNTPVSRYSRMRASANLLNWLKFLKLRCAESAQYEIRCYANVVRHMLTEKFPHVMSLFTL